MYVCIHNTVRYAIVTIFQPSYNIQLVVSESVAVNCKSRLEQRGIPFYRFNPKLDKTIPAGETDLEILLDMVLQTRYQAMGKEMDDLVKMLHDIRCIVMEQEMKKKCIDRVHNGQLQLPAT